MGSRLRFASLAHDAGFAAVVLSLISSPRTQAASPRLSLKLSRKVYNRRALDYILAQTKTGHCARTQLYMRHMLRSYLRIAKSLY